MRSLFQTSMENWARFTCRHSLWVIAAMVLFAGALASQMVNLWIDTSTEGLLQEDDPTRLDYDAFRTQFGRDGYILIAIEPPEVFDHDFLLKLKAFHEEIEDIPKIQEVTSLINVRNTRGEGDELIVGDLLEDFPETKAELASLRERVLQNPLYINSVISRDGRVTAVLAETDTYSSLGDESDDIESGFDDAETDPSGETAEPEFITGDENQAIVQKVEEIVARHQSADFQIYVTGIPVVIQKLQEYVARDMQKFMALAIGIVSLFLYVLFRRISAVLLPVFVIQLSLCSTLGLMAFFGVPVTSTTQIIPSFLLAVGTGYTVHLLVIFFRHLNESGDRHASVVFALGHSGLPILMTALTTMAGMLSFAAASLLPISMFGIFVPVGVFMSFLYSIGLLPALLAALPLRPRPVPESNRALPLVDRGLTLCGEISSGHPWKIVGILAVVIVFSLAGALQVRFSHNTIQWLPEGDWARTSSEFIDAHLGGTVPMEIVLDTGEENGLYSPETLQHLEAVEQRLEQFNHEGVANIGNIVSLLEVVKETHQALNANDPEYYAIPPTRELAAQELLLFENSGSDDLEELVDSQFQTTRITIKTLRRDSYEDIAFIQQAIDEIQLIMGDQTKVVLTGLMPMMTRAVLAAIETLSRSYVLAFLMITPLMMLLIGDLRAGLVSMIPNLTPILITLGFMGWTGIPIDIFSLMIGCIGIGLAVDDTIHLIHSFQRYFAEDGDAELAVRRALLTTGRALLFTSLVLCSGFFVYMASSMGGLFRFGMLTGFMIGVAFLCDIFATPALLVLISRGKK